MDVEDRVGLAAGELRALTRALGEQHTLDEVVRWGLSESPPRLVSAVVIQDEYTHDVVLPWRNVYLVYDTT